MRGMIAHVMTIINRYCSLYQMFTDPEVYGYMWSIHPSVRDDRIYAALLTQLDQRLARLPWARTNKALRGVTEGANKELQRRFHRYVEWIRGPVCNELGDYVSANWFAETGIFDPRRIEALNVKITQDENKFGLYCNKAYGIWTWLAAFRRFSEQLNELGKISHIDNNCDANQPSYHIPEGRNKIKQFLISSAVLHKISKRFRRFILKLWILLKYPPSGKFSP